MLGKFVHNHARWLDCIMLAILAPRYILQFTSPHLFFFFFCTLNAALHQQYCSALKKPISQCI